MKPTQDTGEPSAASAGSVSIGEAHNIGYDEWYCQWYLCPECMKSSINRSFIYCPDCGVQLKWQDSPQNHAMLNEGDEMSASAAGSRRRDVCDWLGCAMLGEKFDLRLLQSAKTEIERLRLTDKERDAIQMAIMRERGEWYGNPDYVRAATLQSLLERTSST